MNICSCITDLIIVNLKLTQHRKSTIFHYMFFLMSKKKKSSDCVAGALPQGGNSDTSRGREERCMGHGTAEMNQWPVAPE